MLWYLAAACKDALDKGYLTNVDVLDIALRILRSIPVFIGNKANFSVRHSIVQHAKRPVGGVRSTFDGCELSGRSLSQARVRASRCNGSMPTWSGSCPGIIPAAPARPRPIACSQAPGRNRPPRPAPLPDRLPSPCGPCSVPRLARPTSRAPAEPVPCTPRP